MQGAASAKLRERTLTDYKSIIRLYLVPALGYLRIDKITAMHIQEMITQLREERKLAAPTIRKAHVVLSSALHQAVRWGMLAHNPAPSVELPRSNRGRRREQIRVLSPSDAARFLNAARGTRWGIVFVLALNSGMRPSEYLALQWKDVDWVTNQIVVRRVLYRSRNGGGWRFEEPKTFGSTRPITLPRNVMQELARHRESQAREKVVFNDTYADNDLVFASTNGQPLDSGNLLNRYLKPLLRACNLDTALNLYSLRHSHATILLAADVHPKIVAERLGHASIQLTLDVYSHVIPSMQKTAADRLQELLPPPE